MCFADSKLSVAMTAQASFFPGGPLLVLKPSLLIPRLPYALFFRALQPLASPTPGSSPEQPSPNPRSAANPLPARPQ